MAIHRGIQSAIFFYLSCAPCAEYRYRKKRKQEAVRNRAEREELEAEMPNLYRHPSPSSTNPFWKAEIELGPRPPPRGKKRSPTVDDTRRLKSSGTHRSSDSHDRPSFDLQRSISQDSRYDSKLRVMHPALDDPNLLRPSRSTRSAARPFTAPDASETIAVPSRLRTKRSNMSETVRTHRHPAVNDLHPPVAPRVSSRDDVSWMLQPPPTADVMAGKQLTSRSRSDSNSSRRSMTTASLISRQVSLKVPQEPIREDDAGSPFDKADTNGSEPGQDHDRTTALSSGISRHDFIDKEHPTNGTTHLPTATSPILSTSPTRPKIISAQSESHAHPKRHEPSLRITTSRSSATELPSRSSPLVPRDTVLPVDDSLAVIRALAPQSQLLATSAGHGLTNHANEHEPRVPTMESWASSDFEVGEWVHEQTKRDVLERWSMDI